MNRFIALALAFAILGPSAALGAETELAKLLAFKAEGISLDMSFPQIKTALLERGYRGGPKLGKFDTAKPPKFFRITFKHKIKSRYDDEIRVWMSYEKVYLITLNYRVSETEDDVNRQELERKLGRPYAPCRTNRVMITCRWADQAGRNFEAAIQYQIRGGSRKFRTLTMRRSSAWLRQNENRLGK